MKRLAQIIIFGCVIYWLLYIALAIAIVLIIPKPKANAQTIPYPIYSHQIFRAKHFIKSEFRCHHCGNIFVDSRLLEKLEQLRNALDGRPIIITSGYRCPIHNKAVGGAAHSQHLQGKAADIKVKGISPAEVARMAQKVGFTWIKVYSGWTHIDIR